MAVHPLKKFDDPIIFKFLSALNTTRKQRNCCIGACKNLWTEYIKYIQCNF